MNEKVKINEVYILSHCPHIEPLIITVGKNNIILYVINDFILLLVIL